MFSGYGISLLLIVYCLQITCWPVVDRLFIVVAMLRYWPVVYCYEIQTAQGDLFYAFEPLYEP